MVAFNPPIDIRTVTGPFPGVVISVQGTTPGPAEGITYTIGVNGHEGLETHEGIFPENWRWPSNVCWTDGEKMIGTVVHCYLIAGKLVSYFIEPPLVEECNPQRPAQGSKTREETAG